MEYSQRDVFNTRLKILTDGVEPDPILNFNGYSDSIVNMIRMSFPKFSIGIYGEWGTGKTTLMRLVEERLKKSPEKDVFAWKNMLDKNSTDSIRLKSFLKENFRLGWLEDSSWVKVDDRTLAISDVNLTRKWYPQGTYEDIPSHSLSIKLDDKNAKATITIEKQKVGEFVVQEENHKTNLYLKNSEILTVWFDAWRYEREERFALLALMKTIAYAMGDLPTYREVKKVLLRGIEIIGKDILRHFALQYAMTEKGVKEFEENLLPKMELLSKVDKDTIYFEGIKKIQEEMKNIAKTNKIIIFIDDLDRCEAKKALEVFESTKIFLDIEGFIFIIGLSYETLSKLISLQYQPIGVRGEEYIRKIIQVYINLPKWKAQDIKALINKFSTTLGYEYIDIFKGKRGFGCDCCRV